MYEIWNRSSKHILEDSRRATRRLALENQIQKVFLEGQTSNVEKIDRIMKQFHHHEEKPEDENGRIFTVSEEMYVHEQPPDLPPSEPHGASQHQRESRERPARSKTEEEKSADQDHRSQNAAPTIASRNEQEYAQLVRRYRADVLTRGLSLKEANIILDSLEGEDVAFKIRYLTRLLDKSATQSYSHT